MQQHKNYQEDTAVNDGSTAIAIISWIFGILFFFIGFVNTFWGNDSAFGVFIILLSLMYFLPVNYILKKVVGFTLPKIGLIKILVGLFIIWASMGVGELPDKVEMMVNSFQ